MERPGGLAPAPQGAAVPLRHWTADLVAGPADLPAHARDHLRRGRRSPVRIGWKLGRWRSGSHLYITVNDGERVVASRIIKNAERDGATTMLLPEGQRADGVIASAFNFVRQRSDLARARIEQIPVPRVADLHAHYPMHLIPPPPRGLRGHLFADLDDARARVALSASRSRIQTGQELPVVLVRAAGHDRVAARRRGAGRAVGPLLVLRRARARQALPRTPESDYIGAVCDRPIFPPQHLRAPLRDAVVAHGPGELDDRHRQRKGRSRPRRGGRLSISARTEEESRRPYRGSRSGVSPTSHWPTSSGATSRPTRLRSPSSRTGSTAGCFRSRRGALEPGEGRGGGDDRGTAW